MDSLSSWLVNHKYEIISDKSGNKIFEIRNMDDGSNKLLKMLDVSELDSKVVEEVVSSMNIINNITIDGLMNYEIIEVNENVLYRVMREYKTHLDIIEPLKYFEESGPFEILNGILMVLKSLNEVRIFHSDLKPSNIFINEENEVVINDYLNSLLYKGIEEMKQVGRKEDLCFVCIDELLGKELDVSSDIWNFGLIFYYVKSGKYPFLGLNRFETKENIKNLKYSPLECECGEELNSFLRKVLVKEKNDRLSLNEISAELKKLNEPHLKIEVNEEEFPSVPFEEEELPIPVNADKIELTKTDFQTVSFEVDDDDNYGDDDDIVPAVGDLKSEPEEIETPTEDLNPYFNEDYNYFDSTSTPTPVQYSSGDYNYIGSTPISNPIYNSFTSYNYLNSSSSKPKPKPITKQEMKYLAARSTPIPIPPFLNKSPRDLQNYLSKRLSEVKSKPVPKEKANSFTVRSTPLHNSYGELQNYLSKRLAQASLNAKLRSKLLAQATAKPVQKPAARPAPKPAPKPAARSAPRPAPRPAPKPAPKPAARSAPRPAPRPAPIGRGRGGKRR